MVNDHMSDLVTRIRNGYHSFRPTVTAAMTKPGFAFAGVLQKNGYLEKVEAKERDLVLTLKYQGKTPALAGIKRISKPGARKYVKAGNLPRVWGGLGINILSTPKGVVSGQEAKKLNVGGEIIAQVW